MAESPAPARERVQCVSPSEHVREGAVGTANLRTRILDFRGFDSSIILMLRAGILISIEKFPEVLSQ